VGAGPGIGRERETSGLVRALAKRIDLPLALDADGVVAFAASSSCSRARRAPTVLTPHPGEPAAVLGVRAAQINADRAGAARELARAAERSWCSRAQGTRSPRPTAS
jgi:NAD(P)H-hydrate epimerase